MSDNRFQAFDLPPEVSVSLALEQRILLPPPLPPPPDRLSWRRWPWKRFSAFLALVVVIVLLLGIELEVQSLKERMREFVYTVEESDRVRGSATAAAAARLVSDGVGSSGGSSLPVELSPSDVDREFLLLDVFPTGAQLVPAPGRTVDASSDVCTGCVVRLENDELEDGLEVEEASTAQRLGIALRRVWLLWDTIASLVHFFIAVPLRFI
jgi:hypothetical protein